MTFDFYGENIFRVFQNNTGGNMQAPAAEPEARILVDNPRKTISDLMINDTNNQTPRQTAESRTIPKSSRVPSNPRESSDQECFRQTAEAK